MENKKDGTVWIKRRKCRGISAFHLALESVNVGGVRGCCGIKFFKKLKNKFGKCKLKNQKVRGLETKK